MPNYGDADYWDVRYKTQKGTTFDWLEGWEDLKDIIEMHCVEGLYVPQEPSEPENEEANKKSGADKVEQMEEKEKPKLVPVPKEQQKKLKKDLRVLNLGCGNSIICEDMYDEGYHNIWNIDISTVCIQQMMA